MVNHNTTHTLVQILLRLGLAVFVGALIGWERQLSHKPAGLRTHIIVSLAAAVYTLIPMQLADPNTDSSSLSRVIQGVATGVGFLGAGEILRDTSINPNRPEIRGLTSAAAIWMSAALGIAAGCGFWQLTILAATISFLVLNVVKRLEKNQHDN